MQQNFLITLSVLILLVFNANVQAQLVKVGVGGGLTQVLGPDNLTKDVSEDGAGYSSEYNLGIMVKLSLPLIPLTPRAFIIYNSLNGSGTFQPPAPALEQEGEISQSITSFGAGVQYGFIPIPVGLDPYLSLDILLNNFGDLTTKVDGEEVTSSGDTRFGLQIGVGTEITIIPLINLDVFAGYNLYNLTGKEDGEDTISALVLDLFVMFNFL